jgi:hypothetical protein
VSREQGTSALSAAPAAVAGKSAAMTVNNNRKRYDLAMGYLQYDI